MPDRPVNAVTPIRHKISPRTIADDTSIANIAESWAPAHPRRWFISQLKASPVKNKPDQVKATMTARSIRLKQNLQIRTVDGYGLNIERQSVSPIPMASSFRPFRRFTPIIAHSGGGLIARLPPRRPAGERIRAEMGEFAAARAFDLPRSAGYNGGCVSRSLYSPAGVGLFANALSPRRIRGDPGDAPVAQWKRSRFVIDRLGVRIPSGAPKPRFPPQRAVWGCQRAGNVRICQGAVCWRDG